MGTLVMKFGGSSVGTTTALSQVLSIILNEHERWEHVLLVVSALDGVTDALIDAAHLAQFSNRRGYRRVVANLRLRHLALVEQLPLGATERAALQADIDNLLYDLLDACQQLSDRPDQSARPESVDNIVGIGEKLAARIVAALLRQNHLRGVAIDATDLVVTDNVYGNATPNISLTRARIHQHLTPMLGRSIIPVITGYIGATVAGKPTTLGRGGSDYTASVLGVCTDADEVWVWTDVDGMMSADPREHADSRVITTLSYGEAAEMAYFGARLLHPRTVAPLRQQRIPLRIRNVFKPQQPGTLISDQFPTPMPVLKAVTSANGLGLSADRNEPLALIAAVVDDLLFNLTGSRADIMISAQSAEQSFACFVIPTTAGPDAVHTVRIAVEERLEQDKTLPWTVRPVNVITAIGSRMDETHTLIVQMFQALNGVRVLAMAQAPSRYSLSVVVDPSDSDRALAQIHNVITHL